MLSGHSLKATKKDEFLAITIQLTEYISSPRKLLSQREPAVTSSILYFSPFLHSFKRNTVSPAALNQFTNENGNRRHVWSLLNVLYIVIGREYNKVASVCVFFASNQTAEIKIAHLFFQQTYQPCESSSKDGNGASLIWLGPADVAQTKRLAPVSVWNFVSK